MGLRREPFNFGKLFAFIPPGHRFARYFRNVRASVPTCAQTRHAYGFTTAFTHDVRTIGGGGLGKWGVRKGTRVYSFVTAYESPGPVHAICPGYAGPPFLREFTPNGRRDLGRDGAERKNNISRREYII